MGMHSKSRKDRGNAPCPVNAKSERACYSCWSAGISHNTAYEQLGRNPLEGSCTGSTRVEFPSGSRVDVVAIPGAGRALGRRT